MAEWLIQATEGHRVYAKGSETSHAVARKRKNRQQLAWLLGSLPVKNKDDRRL